MVPAGNQNGDVNAAPLLEFWARLRPLHQRGLGFDERPGPGLMTSVLPKFPADLAISLDVTGPGQPRLDSGSPPAGWFPLPDAVAAGSWAATHLPPCHPFSDVP